ncbi:MAG: tetratricopeptide repeat protein [Alphaproteobacteria bacterium]|nr:tetratricopeptide repeat protein [Alphaproteobacteria bacterium]MCW5740564.1 tetratricopeptide repeat protein [Alphaproteobacteria bacterium]
MKDNSALENGDADISLAEQPIALFRTEDESFHQQMRLAAAAHRAGRLDEAISSYLRLLAAKPYNSELHNNLGVALRLIGKLDAAVAHHRQSLELDPDNPALHSNLGNALRVANRTREAVRHHLQAVALKPDYAEGFFNLGLCLRDLGRADEALACLSKALALSPQNKRARVEIAITRLTQGDLVRGFSEYEWRKQLDDVPAPEFRQPAWTGDDPAGKRILLYPEQGLADVLMFVRYARELKRRGATVLVLCQALLKELLTRLDYLDGVVAEGEQLPEFDLHASLLSLPHLCGVDVPAAMSTEPYLLPPERGRIKLGRLPRAKLRAGIYWAAMPGQALDRQRSVPFAQFMALAGDPELLFFSLQGGTHQKDILAHGASGLVHDVGRGIFDFAEAASALEQLDLLITIDAPIAHLGAGMGMPTWLLLPTVQDWRWQQRREDSPWYPSLRIFRQTTPGDWDPVFARVAAEIEALKKAAPTSS